MIHITFRVVALYKALGDIHKIYGFTKYLFPWKHSQQPHMYAVKFHVLVNRNNYIILTIWHQC